MSAKPEEKERAYLRNIKVKGFKSIREMDLDLNPLNVLIGANGSGKSNLLNVFTMLNQLSYSKLRSFIGTRGGADKHLYCSAERTLNIDIETHFQKKNRIGYFCNLSYASGDNLWFEEEMVSEFPDLEPRQSETINQGGPESELQNFVIREMASRSQKKFIERVRLLVDAFHNWRVYHFLDTSPTATIKQKCNINDCHFLKADGSNLAAYLYLLKRKYQKYYQNIVETIQLVSPFFHDFDLKPTPENADLILLEWHHRKYHGYYNADSLSDGTLRFICLATLLLQPNLPPLILIDEPELGLHPHAISILASLLRKAAVNTQVIVATQSVTLVNQFKTNDIIVVDRENEESIFSRPDEEEVVRWLEDFEEYGMGDLWEKNIIGGRP